MKKGLLLFAFGLSSLGLFGQENIANSDFENWAGSGSNEPANWHSFLTADCTIGGIVGFFACPIVTGSDQLDQVTSYDGSNCVEIQCVNLSGADANGNLTTGRIHVGSDDPLSADNYNTTVRAGADHDAAFQSIPDSVTFWYKTLFITPTNTAKATFTIHSDADYFDPGGPAAQVVTSAVDQTLSSSTWTRHAIAFVPTGNGATPEYILTTLTTNPVGAAGNAGDKLWIDNIMMIYNMTPSYSFSSICTGESFNLTYTCNTTIADSNKTFYAELSDASGSFALPTVIGSTTRNTGQTASGTISCTIGSVPAGTGYKIRVRHATEDLAEVEGSAFAINAPTVVGTAAPTASTNCTTPNGQVVVSGATANSYELFTTGNVSQGTNGTGSFTGVSPGDYYVAVSNGCLAGPINTGNVTVGAPSNPTAGTTTPTASNNCTTQNGQVAVTGSNGANFELFTGAGASQTNNATGSFTGLNPGTYYVEITTNGCLTTTSTVTVNAPTNPTAGTTTPTASTNCTTPNGQVAVTGSNGASFELFTGAGVSQTSNGTGAFTALTPGDYYVEITTNGCMTTTSTVTVNAPANPAAGTLTPTDVTNCSSPNGQVVVSGSGGTSFELFTGAGVSQTSNGSGTFGSLAADDYYVVVTDAAGCTATTSTETVGNAGSAPAAPSAGSDATYCVNATPTDLTATAGAGGTLTWYLGGSVETTGTTLTPVTTADGVFVYTVTETVTGCESTPTTVTVTVDPDAVAGTATPTASTSCTTPDGQIAVTGDNGTGYELFDSGNTSQGTNATGTFTGLTPGDYYVEVTNGCVPDQTTTVTIAAPADPTVGTVTPSDNGDCATADGEVNVSGSNGASFELFDAGNNSITSNATGAFAGLSGDDYYVVITGVNGCTSTSSNVTVNDPAAPTAGTIASVDETDCVNPNGEVNVTGSNGTSFELFDIGNTSQGSNATGAFTGLGAGDYYVVISNANNCTTTTSNVTVANNTGHTVTVAPATTQNINTNTDGTVIMATESSTATSREWMYTTTSGSGYMSFAPTETGTSYTPNFGAAGTYYVVCESMISGCTIMSSEVEIVVTSAVGIDENKMDLVNVYSYDNQMFVDLSNITLDNPILKVYTTEGKIVLNKRLNNGTMNTFNMDVPFGIYIFNITSNENTATGKVVLK
jgi:hypothetical protein